MYSASPDLAIFDNDFGVPRVVEDDEGLRGGEIGEIELLVEPALEPYALLGAPPPQVWTFEDLWEFVASRSTDGGGGKSAED